MAERGARVSRKEGELMVNGMTGNPVNYYERILMG